MIERMKAFVVRGGRLLFGKKVAMNMRFFLQTAEQKANRNHTARLYSGFLNKGDLFFDIGSNYGRKLESLIGKGVKIVAVEPQTTCCDYLNYYFGDYITVLNLGVGNKQETKLFYRSSASSLGSFSETWIEAVRESNRFPLHHWNEGVFLDLVTLDEIIQLHGTPDFIKIDVEGYESEVLKGLSIPIKVLSFEYTVPERLESAIECLEIVKELYRDQVWFNYSIGETMELRLDRWLNFEEMKLEISSDRFLKSSAGDIYVKRGLTNLGFL